MSRTIPQRVGDWARFLPLATIQISRRFAPGVDGFSVEVNRYSSGEQFAKLGPAAYNDKMQSLSWAHPLVAEWFTSKFGTPTEPQEQGWPHILAGRTTLISAPTGSGKTLAAFLACIDRLVRKALNGELRDRTEVLYVSPLKALGNDIQKNLESP